MKINIDLSKNGLMTANVKAEGFSRKEIVAGDKKYTFISFSDDNIEPVALQDPAEFIKRHNGVLISISDAELLLYNDPFRSIPIYVFRSANLIRIFSNFEDIYSYNENLNQGVDLAGFWETIIFEGGIGKRTLFEHVKQMPAASVLTVTGDLFFKIERYWDYLIELDHRIDSMDKAVDGLFENLDGIFGRLPKDQKYLMGLSGGIDSRLTLAMLSRHLPKDGLRLFTYGFDKRLLEYIYAGQIAEALGYSPPEFHELTPGSYVRCADDLARESGAAIGMQHCHIYDYLRSLADDASRHVLITTAYTDALFGWAVTAEKSNRNFESTYHYKRLLEYRKLMGKEAFETIREDLREAYSGYRNDSNFNCPEEYFYCTERNIKFHNYSSSIYGKFLNVFFLYSDYRLFQYCIGMPAAYRYQKHIVDAIIEKYFRNISNNSFRNISSRDFKSNSSRFQWNGRTNSKLSYYHFKLLNRINAFLVLMAGGKFQFFNKYLTEDHVINFNMHHRELFYQSLMNLQASGIIGNASVKYFKKLPYRPAGISERYQLINIFKALGQN